MTIDAGNSMNRQELTARGHEGGPPALVVRGASMRFGPRLVLDDVDLTVERGEVHALVGANGSGKSTLLSAVARLTPVSAGLITLAGQVMDDAHQGTFVEASGRPIGFVFQNYRLFPHLTVAENVAFSPRARGQGKRAARSAAGYWLDRLRLTDLAERKPSQLSGGQAQKGALARALAGQPALLLLVIQRQIANGCLLPLCARYAGTKGLDVGFRAVQCKSTGV